jgi:hypothetical protein
VKYLILHVAILFGGKSRNSKKFIVAESGEVLQNIRKIWPAMNVVDESVYFNFATGWSVLQHYMYKLAR